MNIKDIEIIESLGQDFYDSFNKFILSSDLKVFGKLLARFQLFEMVKDIPETLLSVVFLRNRSFYFFKTKKILLS